MTYSYSSSNYSDHMDSSATKGNVPLTHYGSGDGEPCSQTGYHDTLPTYGSSSNVGTEADESNRIYVNIPQIEEPVYNEVDSRTLAPEINELINTEIEYVCSLQLLISHIEPRLKEIPEVDVGSLLCNADELLAVHDSFLSELKDTKNDDQNQLSRIGNLFHEYSADMENAYAVYCNGYTRSSTLLQSYQETPIYEKIQEVLQIVQYMDSSKQYKDLSFYLIQPVQRITRYPLFLRSILKNVPQNRHSQELLQRALDTMNEVNININENKRRKEIATKYLQQDKSTWKKKISNLNTHTISKKTNRLSTLLRKQTGMSPKKEDKEFDSFTEKFHRLANFVSQLEENVILYVRNIEAFLNIQPQTYQLELLQGTVHPFQAFSQELCNSIYSVFKRRVQLLVLQPVSNLLECLKGPKNLIKKRADKLLDYENLEKYSETGKITWEEEDIVNNYKCIHSMLISELPQCIALSYQWLQKILLTFMALQKDLFEQGRHAAETHASEMQCCMAAEENFKRWVNDSICQMVSQLSEFIKIFEEESLPPIVQEHTPATQRHIQQLLQRYKADKLFQVVSSFASYREMELSLSRGDVVAVIQLADTKGNKNRWLVDTGASRGYVPSSKLQPYQVEQSPYQLCVSSESSKTSEMRRHSVTAQPSPYPYVPVDIPEVFQLPFQIVAGYPFTARSNYEVSIMAGDPVKVLEPHDKEGRPEWSLVEVSGQRGYVPSNYLIRVAVQANRRP
ncbi:PREDICTED: rho guanine nucleotide exchange factor 37 [Nanorana parkeri]|uniref:rho guanine nucleotide exchange factor 37 n=1 Tax=Nanorana parkeri TaxID=125878 RepID=UPI000854092B|nr:PREDICTED: rho guanine nucleotide exchange factor 37 [Nanorana parkeri]